MSDHVDIGGLDSGMPVPALEVVLEVVETMIGSLAEMKAEAEA